MKIDTLLREEIQKEFKELERIKVGSEEYKVAVEGLTKLVDRAIEMDKFDTEFQNKLQTQEREEEAKQKQMLEDKKDRRVKNGIAIAGLVVPSVITIWGTIKSIQFEKEGTITTIMGRGFINKLLPKK